LFAYDRNIGRLILGVKGKGTPFIEVGIRIAERQEKERQVREEWPTFKSSLILQL